MLDALGACLSYLRTTRPAEGSYLKVPVTGHGDLARTLLDVELGVALCHKYAALWRGVRVYSDVGLARCRLKDANG